MKRTLFFVGLVLLLSAAGLLSADSPQELLAEFLQAMAAMDYAREYTLLCAEDRQAMSEQEYVETIHAFDMGVMNSKDISPSLYEFLTRETLTYKILSDRTEGGKRIFEVEIDFVNHMEVLFGIGFAIPELGDADVPMSRTEPLVSQWLEKNYPDGRPPRETVPTPFTLVQERGSWRVYMNLRREAARIQASQFQEQAEAAAQRREFEQAIELLERAKAADPEAAIDLRMNRYRQELEKKRKIDAFVEQYLTIASAELVPGSPGGIKIVLQDDGPRNLFNVTIAIDLFSAAGEVVKTYSHEFDLFTTGFDKVEKYELEYSFPGSPEGWDGRRFELRIVDVFPVD